MTVTSIHYGDIATRENAERKRLSERLNQLDRSARSRGGLGVGGETDAVFYSIEEKAERDRIAAVLQVLSDQADEYVDPLYVAARDQFNRGGLLIGTLGNPVGSLGADPPGVALHMASGNLVPAAATDVALTLGLLVVDGVVPPPVRITAGAADKGAIHDKGSGGGSTDAKFAIVSNSDDAAWSAMGKAFFKAIGEAQSYKPLSGRVLDILGHLGGVVGGGDGGRGGAVDAVEFAKVMRSLAVRRVDQFTPQLGRKVSEALDEVQNIGGNGVTSELGIDLPDLDAVSNTEIVADNVRLMGPVICAAMLDELKAFQVVDKLLENAQNGTLPIGKGNAGQILYKRWKESPNRMSEPERRDLYAMTMGQPGGNPAIQGNADFNDLWLRFVSSVSQFVRQQDVDRLLRAALPSATGAQQMRKAARDLASNLSLHGYGMTYYAALDLQGEIKQMIALLDDDEIKAAHGAKDMWGVIDVVATRDLGGARTSSRYRVLATCGAIITSWLAKNIVKIMRPTGTLIDMMDVRSPSPTQSARATSDPSDYDLVNACELWLADTAVSDTRVDEMSQPRVSPVMTSQPVPVPAFAREFMDEIPGIGGAATMSTGMGLRNGAAQRQ